MPNITTNIAFSARECYINTGNVFLKAYNSVINVCKTSKLSSPLFKSTDKTIVDSIAETKNITFPASGEFLPWYCSIDVGRGHIIIFADVVEITYFTQREK